MKYHSLKIYLKSKKKPLIIKAELLKTLETIQEEMLIKLNNVEQVVYLKNFELIVSKGDFSHMLLR